jgi:hypothetical protein
MESDSRCNGSGASRRSFLQLGVAVPGGAGVGNIGRAIFCGCGALLPFLAVLFLKMR